MSDDVIAALESLDLLSSDSTQDISMNSSNTAPQYYRPPCNLNYSLIKRTDGVYQFNTSITAISTVHPNSVSRQLCIWLALLSELDTVEISTHNTNSIANGLNDVSSMVYYTFVPVISAIKESAAKTIGVVDSNISGIASLIAIACKELIVTPLGMLNIALPAELGSNNSSDSMIYFYRDVLLKSAVDKGWLTEDEFNFIMDGKLINIFGDELIRRVKSE